MTVRNGTPYLPVVRECVPVPFLCNGVGTCTFFTKILFVPSDICNDNLWLNNQKEHCDCKRVVTGMEWNFETAL